MVSIDSFAAIYAAPTYAPTIERLSRTLKRYLFISGAFATASVTFAIGVSLLALIYAQETPRARAFAYDPFHFRAQAAMVGDIFAFSELPDFGQPAPEPMAAAAPMPQRLLITSGTVRNVNITFYDCAEQGFCGAMYNGRKVYQGAAACSWDLSIGTRFVIDGDPTQRAYVCEDRGLLSDTWVDVFWHDPRDGYLWQAAVGRRGTIEIVEVP
jgi:hypothetical protein